MQGATVNHDPAVSPAASPTWAARLKKWYIVAAVGVFNALLLIVMVNVVLYAVIRLRQPAPIPFHEGHFAADKLQQAYPGWSEQDVKNLIRETPRADHEFEYEPLTGFRERPYRGKYVNVDPAGFRFSKNQAPWPPNPQATNIFIFGGSTAFGYYLPDDETISSYLQAYLSERHSRNPVAVYNFARPAYISSQELVLFQQLLRSGYVPQVAIFIDGLNDFILADGVPKFTGQLRAFMDGQTNSNPLNDIPMVRAAQRLKDRWAPTAAASEPQPDKAPVYDDPVLLHSAVDRWLANKKMIELTGQGYGVRTVFVWQPVPVYKYDLRYHFFLHSEKEFAAYGRAKYGYPLMQDLREQGRLGPDVLWLADIQQDKHENLYVDSVHYSAAFSQEIAKRIGDYLEQQSAQNSNPPSATLAPGNRVQSSR